MEDPWKKRWNERYSNEAYAFGKEPNEYFRDQLIKLQPGQLLLAAEGEGRNAVFAGRQGWTVDAFDISSEGKAKATRLAAENGVSINYQVGELPDLHFKEEQYDALGLIFAHFPASIKSAYHIQLAKYVRKGGVIIFEAFSKNHLAYKQRNPQVGGPGDIESLFSIDELKHDFDDYDFIAMEEVVLYLNEGPFHSGEGSVVRCVARKR